MTARTGGARAVAVMRVVVRIPGQLIILALRGYQKYISPMTPPTCRYYPSCSQYAVIAVQRHGLLKGVPMAVWRVLRCNPWSAGGVDDVPEKVPREHRHGHTHHGSSAADSPEGTPMVETVPQEPTSRGCADVS